MRRREHSFEGRDGARASVMPLDVFVDLHTREIVFVWGFGEESRHALGDDIDIEALAEYFAAP